MFKKNLNEIWTSSVPLIIGGSIITLMTFLDAIYISIYSLEGFNALLLAIPILSLINAFASAIAVSSGDALSKSLSKKDSYTNLYVSFSLGIITSVLVIFFAYFFLDDINHFYGLEKIELSNVKRYFNNYFIWIIPSFIFQTFTALLIQVLVVRGKTKKTNIILIWTGIINIILNPIFIFVMKLDIIGVAIATNIAFLFSFLFCLIVAIKEFPFLMSKRMMMMSFFKEQKDTIKKGLSQFVNSMTLFFAIAIFAIYGIVFTRLATSFGIVALTIYGISEQLKNIFIVPARGVCAAYISVFGKSLAIKKVDQYYNIYWSATLIVGLINFTGIVLLLFFPKFLLTFFGEFENETLSDAVFFLAMGSAFLFVSILPRNSHVGFLSLGHSYGLVLQSFLIVGLSYFSAKHLSQTYGFRGLALGQLVGAILANTPMLFYFFYLLNRRIKRDKTT